MSSGAQRFSARLQVDKIFAEWDSRQSPGCAVALYKDGRILYERGYGMADLEHDVAIAPDTVFYVGSVSKQFTAFAAALAIQKGLLAADDSIRKHLPELPAYADAITVRHLVHHTSGLRDFYTLLSIAGRRQDALFDNPSILRLAARQKALNFAPGEDYLYSNTGYTLLAMVVGRAAKMPFGAFAETHIFKPLGMTSTFFGDDASRVIRGRAYGYTWSAKGEPRIDTPAGERVGAGGLFTTVRDLRRWDENFYSAAVGGKALVGEVQKTGTLASGKPLTYAWGLEIGQYRGVPIVEHGGSLGGYRAHLIRFPDLHFSVAALCNVSSITLAPLVREVSDVAIANRFTEPKPAAGQRGANAGRGGQPNPSSTPAAGDSTSPAELSGVYVSDEIQATFTIAAKGGQLLVQRDEDAEPIATQPAAGGQFRVRNMTIRFTRGPNGRVDALLVDAGRVRDIRFDRK
ncbi:MAG TPA: serine hydrolase domain-containing protein [Vicinamibacterales bacterium]